MEATLLHQCGINFFSLFFLIKEKKMGQIIKN